MASSDLAIRFTENTYATKQEVSRELKMSLIDNIWSNILSYRSSFNQYLSIKSVDQKSYVLCNCASVNNKVNSADAKFIRLMTEYLKLNSASGEDKYINSKILSMSLRCIGKKYEIDVSDEYIFGIINGTITEYNQLNKMLKQYLDAVLFIKDNYTKPLDIDFLAELYSKVSGNYNLTKFYRTRDDNGAFNRVLIDRIYNAAPYQYIEGMMNNLFSFISSSTLSKTCKSIIAYYYVNYIRPFDEYSDEIALLIAKYVLAHEELAEMGAIYPLEDLLVRDQEALSKISVEVQKTNDITYFINYVLRVFEGKSDELLDIFANKKADILKADLYQEDKVEEELEPVEEEIKKEEVVLQEVKPNTPEIVAKPIPAVEVKPIITPVQETRVVETKQEAPKKVKVQEVNEEIAVSYVPAALDEKQAYRLEQNLLESYPEMKKGEARFYSRHCTLGKFYTIEQYKKCIGCVYETARTSMEHLVKMGYYSKQLVNNKKFVYTPIRRD